MAQKFRVTATIGLRVREAPALSGRIAGALPFGAEVEPIGLADGWAILPVDAGGARIRQAGAPAADAVVYASTDWLEPVGIVAPPPTAAGDPRYLLGLNIQGGRLDLAHRAAQLGCRFFLIMDNFAGADELAAAWPDAIVVARRWFQYRADVAGVIQGLEGATSSRLYYMGHNEGDHIGQDGADLIWRAELDRKVAAEIARISGAKYAGATFSMGCPDYTKPAVCQIVQAGWAAAYNAGQMLMDGHFYSPDPEHIHQDDGLIWYERRWEFLFTKCGFDPRRRGLICTEAGLDQGSIGGFPAHGIDGAGFTRWARRWLQVCGRPLVVGGIAYPSPLMGAALFQCGDRRTTPGGWAGYNLEQYWDQLVELWAGR
jgi:hypothetical protein